MLQLRDPNAEFRVLSLARLAEDGNWRTQPMRASIRPLLLWFTRGQGRITVAGTIRGYGPNNAIFIPGGTMYGFDMLGRVLGTAVYFPETLIPDLPDDPLHLRLRDGALQAEMTSYVEALDRESRQERAGQRRAMEHWAGLLGIWLERHADLAEILADQGASQRLTAAYSALVEREFRTSAGVADYADKLGVTPTHLTRACRQSAGRSASRILAERIHYEARRLLLETDMEVQEIARRLGFGSAAYFSRAFQQEAGATPTSFRANPAGRRR